VVDEQSKALQFCPMALPRCSAENWAFAMAFAFSTALALPAFAGTGDPVVGRHLAVSVCANCHVVPDSGRKTAMDAAPPFDTIANDPAMTDERLRHFLNQPHSQMPPIAIARQEVEDVIAYLRTMHRMPPKGRN
jgi:mono/diheme cytochrome c family protein